MLLLCMLEIFPNNFLKDMSFSKFFGVLVFLIFFLQLRTWNYLLARLKRYFFRLHTQAQELDKTEEDCGNDGSVAPGKLAGLQWDNVDGYRPTQARGC